MAHVTVRTRPRLSRARLTYRARGRRLTAPGAPPPGPLHRMGERDPAYWAGLYAFHLPSTTSMRVTSFSVRPLWSVAL